MDNLNFNEIYELINNSYYSQIQSLLNFEIKLNVKINNNDNIPHNYITIKPDSIDYQSSLHNFILMYR